MDNTNNSVSTPPAAPYVSRLELITGQYQVLNKNLMRTREQLSGLFAGCSPEHNDTIHQYLESPAEEDRWLLDGWAKCGRNDHGRSIRVELSEIGRNTVSPFGVACLVRYCRGWIDEAESRVEILRSEMEALSTGRRQTSPGGRDRAKQSERQSFPKAGAGHRSHSKRIQRQKRLQP